MSSSKKRTTSDLDILSLIPEAGDSMTVTNVDGLNVQVIVHASPCHLRLTDDEVERLIAGKITFN